MTVGVELEVRWFDPDLVDLLVTCGNRDFYGQTELYAGRGKLQQWASMLQGFPKSPSDSRTLELGTFRPTYAGGGAKLVFCCLDSAGHAAVFVSLRSVTARGTETAEFSIGIEAAAVDSFVDQLRCVDEEATGSKASLSGMG